MTLKEYYDNQAAEQAEGIVTVVVNGNRDREKINTRLTMHRDELSLAKCQEICSKVKEKYGVVVTDLYFLLTVFDYSPVVDEESARGANIGDFGLPVKKDESARYYAAENSLLIFRDGRPVYENSDGVITKDADALADTYM